MVLPLPHLCNRTSGSSEAPCSFLLWAGKKTKEGRVTDVYIYVEVRTTRSNASVLIGKK